MKNNQDMIQESIKMAKQIRESASKAALGKFTELIAADITQLALNEEFNPGENVPAGFDLDGEQKRLTGIGDPLDKEGNGHAVIEGEIPDNDSTMKLEVEEENDDNEIEEAGEMPMGGQPQQAPAPKKPEDDEIDLNLDLNSADNDEDDKKSKVEENEEEEKEKEKVEDKLKKENVMLKKELARLRTENKQLAEALQTVNTKLVETGLIQQRSSYATKLFSKYPTLKFETKQQLVRHFDSAKSTKAIKSVYETADAALTSSFAKKAIKESTRATQIVESAKTQKKEMIQESTVTEATAWEQRLAEMAGVI